MGSASLVGGIASRCIKCHYNSFSSKPVGTKCELCEEGSTSIDSEGKWCKKNKVCKNGLVVSGLNGQFPGFQVCVNPVTGCPNYLTPLFRNMNVLCDNKAGEIVCPRGSKLKWATEDIGRSCILQKEVISPEF